MQTNQILSAPLIDIIFDGLNKDYGAYELRQHYLQRIRKALLMTIAITGFICCGIVLGNTIKKAKPKFIFTEGPVVSKIPEEQPEEPKPEPKHKTEVRTVIFTAPVIKENDKVETLPPNQDQLNIAAIGNEKKSGIDDSGFVAPGPEKIDKGTGIIENKKPDPDEIVDIVEVDAKYPGNWRAFLERNLNANVPLDNGAPAGHYSVVIQFVVDKEGNVSDITPLTNQGFGMEQEAVRVIKKATKWEPAFQNGYKVKAYRKQVITFEVLEEG